MKTLPAILLAILPAAAAAAPEPTAAPSHAHTLSGTVASMDESGRTVTVRDGKGKQTRVTTTGATRVSGGKLEPGARVTVRWVSRDHKSIATAVLVQAPAVERTAGATPASPLNPTPGRP